MFTAFSSVNGAYANFISSKVFRLPFNRIFRLDFPNSFSKIKLEYFISFYCAFTNENIKDFITLIA